jgi:hypothetical protein
VANALAYHNTATFTPVKSFVVQAPEIIFLTGGKEVGQFINQGLKP